MGLHRRGGLAESSRHISPWFFRSAVILLLATLAVRVEQRLLPPVVPDLIRWVALSDSVGKAGVPARPVLYVWTAEWCAPCKVMHREIFCEPKYAEKINALYVPVRIYDSDESALAAEYRQKFKVKSYPSLVVKDLGGKTRMSLGYRGARKTMAFLEAALAGGAKAVDRPGSDPCPSQAEPKGGKGE